MNKNFDVVLKENGISDSLERLRQRINIVSGLTSRGQYRHRVLLED